MPPLKDVTTMITAARSRHIRFTMIIQNFAQLDQVYGKENAETIRGNCGNIIYLITTELKALEEISKMCGEVKSKKDDKTASTPLVTVSDLQRMKQFEVIILRMRKQPFKTKFTPYFKLDWGRTYPKATYPTREKISVHTFDIKEFVKAQKKKKLLEMMNSTDNNGGANPDMFGAFPQMSGNSNARNPFMPNSTMGGARPRPNTQVDMGMSGMNGMPNMNTMAPVNPFAPSQDNSFVEKNNRQVGIPMTDARNPISTGTPRMPQSHPQINQPTNDSGLGFDVDELVRKIDAKIAELEEEEKQNELKEKSTTSVAKPADDKEKEDINLKSTVEKKSSVLEVNEAVASNQEKDIDIKDDKKEVSSVANNLVLDDEEDDDEFFDDFFDN